MPFTQNKKILNYFKQTRNRSKQKILCKAPFVSMSIDVTGFASPCCYIHSQTAYFTGNVCRYPDMSLREIWKGHVFESYRKQMRKFVFPSECEICRRRLSEDPEKFSKIDEYKPYRINKKFPRIIEFTLDNNCNLECIMCNSVHSSKIARSRQVSRQTTIATQSIIEEMKYFIPHLEMVVFSGGEPFLSKVNIELMNMILSVNSNCHIAVNTNGTILTDEIRVLLEKGNFHLNISIDSITKETYEKIRQGAKFETLCSNLRYFKSYSQKKKIPITIPVCPLLLNYKEIPDLLEYCNNNNFFIQFVHVFNAHSIALSSGSAVMIEDAIRFYENVKTSGTNMVQIANNKRYADFVNGLYECRSIAEKKAVFIESVSPDYEFLKKWNRYIDDKIYAYIVSAKIPDVEIVFEKWITKRTALVEMLPTYFYCRDMLEPILMFDEAVLLQYFSTLPIKEIADYLITFGNEIISKK